MPGGGLPQIDLAQTVAAFLASGSDSPWLRTGPGPGPEQPAAGTEAASSSAAAAAGAGPAAAAAAEAEGTAAPPVGTGNESRTIY